MALRTDLTRPRWIVGTMLGAALCAAASALAGTTPPAAATTTPAAEARPAKPAKAKPAPHPVMTVENAAAIMKQAASTPKPVAHAKPVLAPKTVPVVAALKPAPVKARDRRFADVKSAGTHGRPLSSPGYAMTVSASHTQTFRSAKPAPAAPANSKLVARAPKPAPAPGKAMAPATPAQVPAAAATFNERMSRTTVTPPVMASGAKAVNLQVAPPARAAPTAKPSPVPVTLAAANAKPAVANPGPAAATLLRVVTKPVPVTPAPAKVALRKSPPPGAKQAWHFREVATVSSSTAKLHGAVALTPGKATASHAKPVVIAAKPLPAAKPSPAPQFAAVKSGATSGPMKANPAPGKLAGNVAIASVKTSMTTRTKSRSKTPLTTSVQNLGARFMEQREQYVYNSLNRRDPYASLVSGAFEGEVGTPLLDVSSMKLVGIVWGSSDKFALVEDGHGHGFVLRVGDPVLNGYIAGLTKEELIVKQSSYGDTQTVTIQLQRKEGASNAN